MALPTSGQLTLSQIQTEFGGTSPINISEYYRGGIYVPDTATNSDIPTSGMIAISDFYGGSSTPALISYSVPYGPDASSACTTTRRATVYQASVLFNLNEPIYSDSGGTTFAIARYYKTNDPIESSRYWTGTAWSGTATLC